MLKISLEKLNNPPKETIEARNRFLKECEKLDIKEENGITIIELNDTDINI